MTAVISKPAETLRSHRLFKRPAPSISGSPIFILHHEGDVAREIEVALVVIAVPVAPDASIQADEG